MIEDIEYKRFRVVKTIAKERIGSKKVWWDSSDLFTRIRKAGLEDAQALLRIFEKILIEHNSKIDADLSRVDNLHYKSNNVYKSKYFRGISISIVFKAIEDNPDLDVWEIAKMFLEG